VCQGAGVLAATCVSQSADDPLSGLEVGQRPEPDVPQGWERVHVRAASLNHHDLWSLKGVGLPADRLPMVLGCDAAGVTDDGREVVVHALVGDPDWDGDETLDPRRSILSEVHQGTLAEQVVVPARNLVPKPAGLSFEEAACLPTAWLTAYRMLFTQSGLQPGDRVLVQGAGGGVATAAITLARAAGFQVWATSRDEDRRARAEQIGAHQVFETGARLPGKVDAVVETVGKATWSHSMRALRPGGTLVVSGATTGADPSADLNRLFFLQLRVVGSTMGTRSELHRLLAFCEATGVRPLVDQVLPLAAARSGFERLAAGDLFGKLVLTP
jgi:NADPH:quinone reductase-like Zn-dependent oxidoreductase